MTLCIALLAAALQAGPEPPLQVAFEDPLAKTAENPPSFWYSEPGEWKFVDSVPDSGLGEEVKASGPCLYFKSERTYQPPYRSPHSLALVAGLELRPEYVLEVEAMQAGVDTPHRDLVLVFGFKSARRFYYAHLGMVPDAHSSNVFHVSGAARERVGEIGERGIAWGRGTWHRLRLECGPGKRARVYFDGAASPVFDVTLPDAPSGMVGFGSFDDAGAFRRLRVLTRGDDGKAGGPPAKPFVSSPFGGETLVAIPGDREPFECAVNGATVRCLEAEYRAGRGTIRVRVADVDRNGRWGTKGDLWRLRGADALPSSYRRTSEQAALSDSLTITLSAGDTLPVLRTSATPAKDR